MKFKIVILLFILSQYLLGAVKNSPSGIEFIYDAPSASEIFLAGSFNDWNVGKNRMIKGSDEIWKITLKLQEGSYTYKFIVDGSWNFDQDNPDTEDDGYGGANSVIEVDSSGKLVLKGNTGETFIGIKSNFNPKVYFTGRYYTINRFQNNEKPRYELNKPEHDVNFGIKVKLNKNFEGFTMLNVNNNNENTDMWKTHLNYKRSYLKLNTEYFDLKAFDDIGVTTLEDPLHILGSEGKDNYDFGYGFRGLYLKTPDFFSLLADDFPINANTELIFSDRTGNDERDVNAGRLKLNYLLNDTKSEKFELKFGSSLCNSYNKITENYEYELPDTSNTYTGKIHQKHTSFEIDVTAEKNIFHSGWVDPMQFLLMTEYLEFTNSNEFKQFENVSDLDSLISKRNYDWLTGDKIFLGTKITFPQNLVLQASYTRSSVVFNIYTPSEMDFIINAPYFDPNFQEKEILRNQLDLYAEFYWNPLKTEINFSHWTTDYPDTLVNWSDYYRYTEKTDGNGRWFQEHSEYEFEKLSLIGLEKGIIWKTNFTYDFALFRKKIELGLENIYAQSSILSAPRYIDNVFMININISRKWLLHSNSRIPIYNNEMWDIKTDILKNEDLFFSNYSEIAYKISDNVRLSLGWGVNPIILNSITDDFYMRGREEFLDNETGFWDYVEKTSQGLGNKIREAEKALLNEQRITLEADINF